MTHLTYHRFWYNAIARMHPGVQTVNSIKLAHYSQKAPDPFGGRVLFASLTGLEPIQCRCPVGICLPPFPAATPYEAEPRPSSPVTGTGKKCRPADRRGRLIAPAVKRIVFLSFFGEYSTFRNGPMRASAPTRNFLTASKHLRKQVLFSDPLAFLPGSCDNMEKTRRYFP